ncbi:Protein of unknown function (DUF3006) [Armatimonadetes bacterium GBS]|jgi:hypothetical protein|nr:Protein of unknown function (DUF3006) [Armatimonadetes bacterium GBS]CUU36785.1 Protein of unknown function (DUF3006) [Armatimonadetes bacterium GXS]
MRRVFVDRIESRADGEPLAVLLVRRGEGDYLEWHAPLSWLPEGTREGDSLVVHFEPDPETRAQLRQEIEDLLRELQQDEE